jgi:hypothetical protein
VSKRRSVVVHTVQSTTHGGKRVGAGAPRGNVNGRRGIQLPDWLKLKTSDEILRFMREILIPATLSGQLGCRQSSAITTACKLLLDYESLQSLEKRIKSLEENREVKAN